MKKLMAVLLALVILAAAGAAWLNASYRIVDARLYPKKAQHLDLRGEEISLRHYEKLRSLLPECEILWDVPFQGDSCASDIRTLTVTEFSQEDADLLAYFPLLETLDAEQCRDLSWVPEIKEERPELDVRFALTLNGRTYPQDSAQIEAASITETELALLPYMTQLRQVTVTEGADAGQLQQLRDYCREAGIAFGISVNGETLAETQTVLSIAGLTENQAQLLMLADHLQQLHISEPQADAQTLLEMRQSMPDTKITWTKSVLGVPFPDDAREIDLTSVIARAEGEEPDEKTAYEYACEQKVMGTQEEVPSSAKVLSEHPLPNKQDMSVQLITETETAMAYFPNVEKLVMCGAWLDNEAMAQFRENQREKYKVVWSVECGALATRTDATLFMPTKYFVTAGSFADWNTYNLKYCEDMVSIDIGHMSVAQLEFVRYMPKLKYLDIALNHILDLSPLAECENLVFLVMHTQSVEQDYTPLLQCKQLEDLNIGGNKGNIEPILQMKQLKNLWITQTDSELYRKAKAALPETNIGYDYSNSNSGWRELPNYFKMRDALLMFYMK